MGYGIVPTNEPDIISIDILPYLLWSENYSIKNDSRHTVIIADELAKYNGLDVEEAREVGRKKKCGVSSILRHHGLRNIDVLCWNDISSTGSYQKILKHVKKVNESIQADDNYRRKLISYVPKRHRDNDLGYVFEETSSTIYFSKRGIPIKIGWDRERMFDKATRVVIQHDLSRSELGRVELEAIYLDGGYNIDSRSRKSVTAPYITATGQRRINYGDSRNDVLEKLKRSGIVYRNWCGLILDMLGKRPLSEDGIPDAIYNEIVEPIEVLE